MTGIVSVVNGMIVLDNGMERVQTRIEEIKTISILPPNKEGTLKWRVVVFMRTATIIFSVNKTQEDAIRVSEQINKVIKEITKMESH